ncbi:MAG: hypothetical protein ACP5LM_04250 [Thermoplasmata archaeon]
MKDSKFRKFVSSIIIKFNMKKYLPLLIEWEVFKINEKTDNIVIVNKPDVKGINTFKQLLSLIPFPPTNENIKIEVFNFNIFLNYVFDLVYGSKRIADIIESFKKKDALYSEFVRRTGLILQVSLFNTNDLTKSSYMNFMNFIEDQIFNQLTIPYNSVRHDN